MALWNRERPINTGARGCLVCLKNIKGARVAEALEQSDYGGRSMVHVRELSVEGQVGADYTRPVVSGNTDSMDLSLSETPGHGGGPGSLTRCGPWGRLRVQVQESDTT